MKYLNIINVDGRFFEVIRVTQAHSTSEETQQNILNSHELITSIIKDKNNNILYCHEIKDAIFRDIEQQTILKENNDNQ